MNSSFICKSFQELSVDELYDILQLRSSVFVVEQCCAYQDMDDKDKKAHHLMLYDDGRLAGYARLLPQKISYDEVSIGRVANTQKYRSKGIGKMLMKEAVNECYRLFGKTVIKISAQVYAIAFYEKVGFKTLGNEYLEDGIPHIKMILN